MCEVCGCDDPSGTRIISMNHPHDHSHPHSHEHTQDLRSGHTHERKEVLIEQNILHKNQLYAERNRGYFEARSITALNLVSSPGSGKTTLVEEIIRRMGKGPGIYVVEGDQQSTLDADRIAFLDVPVVQINTGNSCHLEAETLGKAVKQLNPREGSILIIENVGNLMCPSLFDLGETYRVVLLSTAEGDDKPLKYPNMFFTSHLCIISKCDLAPYTGFNVQNAKNNALMINPRLQIIELSAKTGEGMQEFVAWLTSAGRQ